MVHKFPGKSSRKFGNCWISEKQTIQPKIPKIFWNYANSKFFYSRLVLWARITARWRSHTRMMGTSIQKWTNILVWNLPLVCQHYKYVKVVYLFTLHRLATRFITRAEPLYYSLNPCDIFAAVVQFPKSEPFNRKFPKFWDENQMNGNLQEKKFKNSGVNKEVVLFSENYINS